MPTYSTSLCLVAQAVNDFGRGSDETNTRIFNFTGEFCIL